jgi:response regulator NasT
MKGDNLPMESALIVSCTKKDTDFFTEMLNAASIRQITVLQSCGEVRRLLLERNIDLVIVNTPLQDETGESLARQIVSKGSSQAILIVKSEHVDAIAATCENDGVLTLSKPVDRTVFWAALTLAKAAQNRIKAVQGENERLKLKMEDIRLIDRAKWKLVSHLKMNEQDAHRFIEKQAMDRRSTKRAIAEAILKTYEN